MIAWMVGAGLGGAVLGGVIMGVVVMALERRRMWRDIGKALERLKERA